MTIFTHYSVNSATMWLFMSILTHINVHIQTTFLDCLLTAFPRYYHLKTGWQCGLYNPENDSSVVGSSLLWAHIVWFLPNSKQKAVVCWADMLNTRLKNLKYARTTSILLSFLCPLSSLSSPLFLMFSACQQLDLLSVHRSHQEKAQSSWNPSKTGCASEVCLL